MRMKGEGEKMDGKEWDGMESSGSGQVIIIRLNGKE